METPTDQQIKIDYLVDLISRFRYVVASMVVLSIILCIGMIFVAADNKQLRLEVKKSFQTIESHHAHLDAVHEEMRTQNERIARKLRKLSKGD